jgi:hypothetical protein
LISMNYKMMACIRGRPTPTTPHRLLCDSCPPQQEEGFNEDRLQRQHPAKNSVCMSIQSCEVAINVVEGYQKGLDELCCDCGLGRVCAGKGNSAAHGPELRKKFCAVFQSSSYMLNCLCVSPPSCMINNLSTVQLAHCLTPAINTSMSCVDAVCKHYHLD